MVLWSTILRPGRTWSAGVVQRALISSSSSSFSYCSSATFCLPRRLQPTLRANLLSFRLASTAQAIPRRFPERLLVYHAGTPRTTFLACLKVTTLFGLAFFTFLVAPAYIAADKPLWQVLGVAACGLVPFAIVAYTTHPYVVFVHLRLPAYARHPDRELLRRFVRSAPAGTQLDITTMNLVGRPRLTTAALGDLAPARERLRIVNLVDGRQLQQKEPTKWIAFAPRFPWVQLPPTARFGAPATGNSRGVREGWAWAELLALVERRAAGPAKQGA